MALTGHLYILGQKVLIVKIVDDHKCHYVGEIGTIIQLGTKGTTRDEFMYEVKFEPSTFNGGRGHRFFESELKKA